MANAAMKRQRRLLALAALAGFGLAGAAAPAGAQPAPFSDEPTRYRSNKPYQAEVERTERRRRNEEADAREQARPVRRDVARDPVRTPWLDPSREYTGDESPLAVTGGVDFRDNYFFRGYNRTSGLQAQPYLQAGYTVHRDRDFSITPHAQAWLNVTEEQGANPPAHFNEFRGHAGVAVQTGNWVLDFQYVYYTSPGDAFDGDVHEVGVDVRYDDGDAWRGDRCPITGLNPSLALFYEAKDDRDDDYNTFVGAGLEPALRPFMAGSVPITVSFPVSVGGSYDGYYQGADGHNANFGYWEAGVRAALPLGGRSALGLAWSLDAEVNYVNLMARSAREANGFDDSDVVFRIGLTFR